MKRTPLLRRTPLSRGTSVLSRSKPMARGSKLVSRVKARTEEQGGDPRYLAFVRLQPCCRCGALPPSHAHHEILNGRGKSQKAPDSRTLPLCARCHDDFHAVRGRFADLAREQRKDFQDVEITRLRAIWLEHETLGVWQEPEKVAV